MAKEIGKAFVRVGTDTTAYKKGMSGVKSDLGKFGANVGRLVRTGAVAAGAGIAAAVGLGFSKIADEEASMAKLNAVLKSTGNVTGLSRKEFEDLATEMQNTTRFGNDTVRSTQAMLATFTNIRGPIFKGALKNIADMSTIMGTDLKQSALQVGKALNDPIQGMTALSRVGVAFTNEQKEQVRAMVDAGNVMGAQKLILNELNREFGGAAEAVGDTMVGSLIKLKNEFGDMMGAFLQGMTGGNGIQNLVEKAVVKFREWSASAKEVGFAVQAFVKAAGAQFQILWTRIKTTFELFPDIAGWAIRMVMENWQVMIRNMITGMENLGKIVVNIWKNVTDDLGHLMAKFWEEKVMGRDFLVGGGLKGMDGVFEGLEQLAPLKNVDFDMGKFDGMTSEIQRIEKGYRDWSGKQADKARDQREQDRKDRVKGDAEATERQVTTSKKAAAKIKQAFQGATDPVQFHRRLQEFVLGAGGKKENSVAPKAPGTGTSSGAGGGTTDRATQLLDTISTTLKQMLELQKRELQEVF